MNSIWNNLFDFDLWNWCVFGGNAHYRDCLLLHRQYVSLSALYFPAQIQSSSATLDIEDPQKLFAKRLLERYERQLFVNAIVSFVCFLDLASPLSKLWEWQRQIKKIFYCLTSFISLCSFLSIVKWCWIVKNKNKELIRWITVHRGRSHGWGCISSFMRSMIWIVVSTILGIGRGRMRIRGSLIIVIRWVVSGRGTRTHDRGWRRNRWRIGRIENGWRRNIVIEWREKCGTFWNGGRGTVLVVATNKKEKEGIYCFVVANVAINEWSLITCF